MAEKKSSSKIKKNSKRIALVYLGLALFFIFLFARLFYLMVIDSKELKKVAATQWTSDVTLGPKRGNILDRNAHELAMSADIYRVDLDLIALKQTLKKPEMSDKQLKEALNELAKNLASILNMKEEDVNKAFNTTLKNGLPASWAPLKRQVEKSEADKIKALKVFGILVSSDSKRYYPRNNFLSHVIGSTNSEGTGISGVEQTYNKELMGEPGRLIYERDSKSNELYYENSRYTKPVDGKSVVLTIDEVIQNYAEKTAQKALTQNKAKGVSILVMNPKNGEILAMVNKPDFNPNSLLNSNKSLKKLQSTLTNSSVQNSFEPGSIFKVITAAAAMEYGTSKENDKFVCNGSLKVGNEVINCWTSKGHGTENFIDILKNSCNVGFMHVGQALGKDKLHTFIEKMGFGSKTGIDLPGESSGIVMDVKDIKDVELATISFGQGIALTQVQYMAAFNAIANGGTWIKPHIMKSIVHYDDNGDLKVDETFNDFDKKQVLDSNLTKNLRRYMEKVVSEGVGSGAYIKELNIGGKTGTAQKVTSSGAYGKNKYISSFAGLAPYEDPKISLIITINEPNPSNYYAGSTAAPAAKELFNDIFNYITINRDVLK